MNTPNPEPGICDQCGAPLSPETPEGLCTRCLARFTLLAPDTDESEPAEALFPDAPTAPLQRFGDYELLEEIAHGGMGVVYRARQISLNRIVAVKMLLFGQFAGKAAFERFRVEAETVARLQHPNIVAIHEIGETDGQPFFSMDYVAGHNLADLAREQPLPAKDAVGYLRQIARAVEYAHTQGVLHRDLKPANVLIDAFDEPRITDFGLARKMSGDSQLTLSGQVLGSPNFMPPEQGAGKHAAIGPTSDIYGLGAVLYYLLTARPPFVAETFESTLNQVLHAEAVPPRHLNPSIPPDLETICLKCLEKDPSRRYASAGEVADELDRFLKREPIRARPLGPLGRTWRWCRRKPSLAGMSFVLVLVLGIDLTSMLSKRERVQGTVAAESAQHQRGDEAQGRQLGPFVAHAALPTKQLGTAPGKTHYVWLDSPEPQPPYTNWATAAHLIQDAADAAAAGDEVLVTNGLYATGGRAAGTNLLGNRVAVEKPLVLRSVNGPQFTRIEGGKAPTGGNGTGAVRCVYLTDGAGLYGFTLTNGATHAWSSVTATHPDHQGGGVFCGSTNALVVNCILTANTCGSSGAGASGATLNNCLLAANDAFYEGGGAAESVLNDCIITENTAGMSGAKPMPIGGGAWMSTLSRCTLRKNSSSCEAGGAGQSKLYFCLLADNSAPYGGGAWGDELNNCTLTNNSASDVGGGVLCSTLNNCVLTGNSAAKAGGGALGGWQGEPSTLNNCTLTGNSAPVGGGATDCTLNNCILYANTAPDGANYSGGTLNNCCTTPLPKRGDGNIALDPQLVDAAHIGSSSPCRRAGDGRYVTGVDIDGEPWVRPPSIGCDEFHETGATR